LRRSRRRSEGAGAERRRPARAPRFRFGFIRSRDVRNGLHCPPPYPVESIDSRSRHG
jgi:hypothetical protein